MTRTDNAIKNSFILSSVQVINIVLKFISQTVFIRCLGQDYLGLNGLFTNILSVLSFADLGIGTSIVFALYEPLAKNNKEKISALMALFRKAYDVVGIVIGVIGLAVLPLLPYLAKNGQLVEHAALYFLLFLANSVISYFFTYKRSLLVADQHEYISALNQCIFTFIQVVLQIGVLLLFDSYSLYLLCAILSTFISNIFISHDVNKRYPYIKKQRSSYTLPRQEIKDIEHNVAGMIGWKIGSIVVRSTDNILLSMFRGISLVGLYSNYLLIVTNISAVLNKLVSSVTASIGNLINSEDSGRAISVFKRHYGINFFLTTVSAGCLLVALNPFVSFWIGKKYTLSFITVLVIVVNFFVDQLRQSSITFISAYGLFTSNGKKSVVEAIINLCLSLLFLKFVENGIVAVLLGTLSTNLILNSWWEPRLLFSSSFKALKEFRRFYFVTYLGSMLTGAIFIGVGSGIAFGFDYLTHVTGLVAALVNIVLMMLVMLFLFRVFFSTNDAYRFVVNVIAKKKKHWLERV